MPSFDVLLAFIVTTALFSVLPGPSMLYAAARTMAGGRQAGLMAALGLHLGAYAHVAAAAAGLSVLFHAVPIVYAGVKLAGALYLIWLGITLFRARQSADAGTIGGTRSARQAFAQSITVEVLNPKTALFFLAFLPQFVDGAASFPLWLQFAILGTVANVLFGLVDIVVVMLAAVIIGRLKRSSGVQRLMRRVGGAILVGMGVHLALQRG
ncbi:LysE family translocator [Labrys sp. La1]|uniref:LysE family translocator n=1 Tax=Labrys sp. La1 TaxID=3404917 RepID=UPI003EC09DE7